MIRMKKGTGIALAALVAGIAMAFSGCAPSADLEAKEKAAAETAVPDAEGEDSGDRHENIPGFGVFDPQFTVESKSPTGDVYKEVTVDLKSINVDYYAEGVTINGRILGSQTNLWVKYTGDTSYRLIGGVWTTAAGYTSRVTKTVTAPSGKRITAIRIRASAIPTWSETHTGYQTVTVQTGATQNGTPIYGQISVPYSYTDTHGLTAHVWVDY